MLPLAYSSAARSSNARDNSMSLNRHAQRRDLRGTPEAMRATAHGEPKAFAGKIKTRAANSSLRHINSTNRG
jgi:hypothetical protein